MPTDRALDLNRNSYRNSLSHVNQIPPRSNGSSTRSSNVGVSRPDTTNSQPTIWRSLNSHQSEFGDALMSPRPSTTLADLAEGGLRAASHSGCIVLVEAARRGRGWLV